TIRVTVTSPTCQDFMCSRAILLSSPLPRRGEDTKARRLCRLAAVGEGRSLAERASWLRAYPSPSSASPRLRGSKLHYPLPYQGERAKSRRSPLLHLRLVPRHALGRQLGGGERGFAEDEVGRALADHHAGGVGVAADDRGHH